MNVHTTHSNGPGRALMCSSYKWWVPVSNFTHHDCGHLILPVKIFLKTSWNSSV